MTFLANPICPLPRSDVPPVLFRVEINDKETAYPFGYHTENVYGDLVPRDARASLDRACFARHLDIANRTATPLLSFFASWSRALARRRYFLRQGAYDITILVLWSEGMDNLYSAHDAARSLEDDLPRPTLGPESFQHEYLVHGTVPESEGRVLARFDSLHDQERLDIIDFFDDFTIEVWVPSGVSHLTSLGIMDWLEDQIDSCTLEKKENDFKLWVTLCSIAEISVLPVRHGHHIWLVGSYWDMPFSWNVG